MTTPGLSPNSQISWGKEAPLTCSGHQGNCSHPLRAPTGLSCTAKPRLAAHEQALHQALKVKDNWYVVRTPKMLESPETTSGGDSDSKTIVLLAIKFGSQVLTRHTLQRLEEVSPLWATSVRGRYKCISESFVSHQRPGLHLPMWGY